MSGVTKADLLDLDDKIHRLSEILLLAIEGTATTCQCVMDLCVEVNALTKRVSEIERLIT